MSAALEQSWTYCRNVARKRARNFYYSFVLLPREKKNAMCAMYAFMRYCDDLSDEPGATRGAIDRWRQALTDALAGRPDNNLMWPAFLDAVVRYSIPHEYFYEMIEGVASDLESRAIATFAELYQYCYQVASVVGLTTVHVFGFASPDSREAALPLAEQCGIAFQLTNILRDVREDAELGRVYIPLEDLDGFGVRVDDLRERRRTEQFGRLMEFEADRARRYYRESAPLLNLIDPQSRPALWALISIYSRLLEHVAESHFDVLTRRISLSSAEKTWIVLRAAIGWI
ncbi:MAG TPA: phytoene/squalene synthase family protein [Bryobacteraceae bacterium]|jgi:phytoene synthase|nr:phytoene/squalene synthase family protein [Bryobacteraceae bacterium]